MSDDQKVKITVKDNGSLRVEGDFTILDVEGNEIQHSLAELILERTLRQLGWCSNSC